MPHNGRPMKLADHFTRSGDILFRWRGYLPLLMLPRDRRRQGVLLAAGATIPVLLVMVTAGAAG